MQILTIEPQVAFIGTRGFMGRPVQNPSVAVGFSTDLSRQDLGSKLDGTPINQLAKTGSARRDVAFVFGFSIERRV